MAGLRLVLFTGVDAAQRGVLQVNLQCTVTHPRPNEEDHDRLREVDHDPGEGESALEFHDERRPGAELNIRLAHHHEEVNHEERRHEHDGVHHRGGSLRQRSLL